MKERQSGYYWVRYKKDWRIYEYDPKAFDGGGAFIVGALNFPEKMFDEIDETPIVRTDKTK